MKPINLDDTEMMLEDLESDLVTNDTLFIANS